MTIHTYYDRNQKCQVDRLLPGDFSARKTPSSKTSMMMTVLGSCVSVCLTDAERRIAGLNHFMLPGSISNNELDTQYVNPINSSARYGANAMELLINQLLELGAERSHLQAWVFGGAKVLQGASNIGQTNINFALAYLKREKIPIAAQDTGGTLARRLYLDSASCRPACFTITRSLSQLTESELRYARQLQSITGAPLADISLFSGNCA